jgi:Uncharacterized membrane protein, required for N-linked glycosylation
MVSYSLGIFLATLMIAVGTAVLYFIAFAFKKFEKPWYFYLGALVVLAIVGILVAMFALPSAYYSAMGSLSQFFSNSATAATIQEMQSWTTESAWNSFNFGILLSIGGVLWLIYELIKGKREEALFILIWSVIMFMATISHMRWEYYVAANIVLLSAICIAETVNFAKEDVLLLLGRGNQPSPNRCRTSERPEGRLK